MCKADLPCKAAIGSMPEGDIEALAFLVMMQAAKSAQEDLKAVMKGVKDINKEKGTVRETQAELQKEVCEHVDEREGRTPTGKRHRVFRAGRPTAAVKRGRGVGTTRRASLMGLIPSPSRTHHLTSENPH